MTEEEIELLKIFAPLMIACLQIMEPILTRLVDIHLKWYYLLNGEYK